jgi:hypothetical protein
MKQTRIIRSGISALVAGSVGALSTVFTHRTVSNPEANLSSWHINYDQGYVRRGLQGEVMELWTNFSKLSWDWSESILRSISISILVYLLFSRATTSVSKKNRAWTLFIFPLGPLYFLFDPGNSGNTDSIFFLFAYFVFWYWEKNRGRLASGLIFSASTLLSLLHEGYIFFLPAIAILIFTTVGTRLNAQRYWSWWAFVSLPFIFQLSWHLVSPMQDFEYYCQLALTRGIKGDCTPLVFFGEMGVSEAIAFSTVRSSALATIALALWAIGLFFLTVRVSLSLPHVIFSNIILQSRFFTTGLLFLLCGPIFLIGSDWGRWLSIIFMVVALNFLFFGTKPIDCLTSRLVFVSMFLPVISGTGSALAGLAYWGPWVINHFLP